MKQCSVGGQAVMEGVMMKSPDGIAIAVRKPDGSIATTYKKVRTKAQKGTFLGWPVVRGVVTFVESLTTGMKTITESAEMIGIEEEEPTKFEKWLSKVFGKTIDKIVMGLAVIIAIALAVGLFFILPNLISGWIFGEAEVKSVWKSLAEGGVRLVIFIGYLLFCSCMKEVRRVFMYHGAEHKTIACYEHDDDMTPENAMKYKRLHPRCGTNYLFLVMAVSILFFAAIGWSDNFLIRLGTRIVFVPVVAGLSYELLRFAAKYDNILTRIIRAPGMGLQLITTKEPTMDMIEVAIESFKLAMDPDGYRKAQKEKLAIEIAKEAAAEADVPAEADKAEADVPAEANASAEANISAEANAACDAPSAGSAE